MNGSSRQVIVIGGPNGAGKSTIAKAVLAETLRITEFVNADTIAAGLSGFEPERAAFAAGRIMLGRLHDLSAAGESFAFESTLASRTFAPWLRDLAKRDYRIRLLYVWLDAPELAVSRVRVRASRGGHNIPPEITRRRYQRSVANFFRLYMPLADSAGTWRVYDNSRSRLRLVAFGGADTSPIVRLPSIWQSMERTAHGDASQALGNID